MLFTSLTTLCAVAVTCKAPSTLSPKTVTVAEKCDCRRQIVAEIGDYSRSCQCGQALIVIHQYYNMADFMADFVDKFAEFVR